MADKTVGNIAFGPFGDGRNRGTIEDALRKAQELDASDPVVASITFRVRRSKMVDLDIPESEPLFWYALTYGKAAAMAMYNRRSNLVDPRGTATG